MWPTQLNLESSWWWAASWSMRLLLLYWLQFKAPDHQLSRHWEKSQADWTMRYLQIPNANSVGNMTLLYNQSDPVNLQAHWIERYILSMCICLLVQVLNSSAHRAVNTCLSYHIITFSGCSPFHSHQQLIYIIDYICRSVKLSFIQVTVDL